MLSRKLLVQPVRSIIRPNTQALRAASTVDQSSLLKFAWTPRALSLYEAHMEFKKFAEESKLTTISPRLPDGLSTPNQGTTMD